MTAVIQTEQKGERSQGCVLRMCLLMSRLFAAAASFLEGRAESHWDQHDLERGGAGGQPCGADEGQSCAPGTPPDADSQTECRSGGDESRTGPNSKGAVSRGGSKRSPAGKGPRNPSRKRGAKRRKRKGGKGVDDGPEFMREMAGGLGTTLAMTLLAGLGMKFSKKPNARYGLPDMYRMLLAMCSREGGESSAKGAVPEGEATGMCPGHAQSQAHARYHQVGAARLHADAVQGHGHPLHGTGPPARDAAPPRGRLNRHARHPVLCPGAGDGIRGVFPVQEGHQKVQPPGHPALCGGRAPPHPGRGGRYPGGWRQRPGGTKAAVQGAQEGHPHVVHHAGSRVPLGGRQRR